MTVLVLGATGMTGNMVSNYLYEKNYNVVGLARREMIGPFPSVIIDVLDFQKLKNYLYNNPFDYIINCIGILNNDAEKNKSEAVLINSYLPYFLSEIASQVGAKLIHISTDCVFSGKRGGYRENDFRDGDTFYDRSKALGEIESENHLTLRTSLIGPDTNENGIGLLNWFMKQNGLISGYKNVIWTGITTLQLAKVIEKCFNMPVCGLYNLVYNEPISKLDLIRLMNKYFKNNATDIKESETPLSNKSLAQSNCMLCNDIPNYETMLKELAEWTYNHKSVYPDYYTVRL